MAVAIDRRSEERFKRFGLGFQYRPIEAPVLMTFNSVSEKRGEIRAEVHVTSLDGGHILRRYLNLLGSTSMRDLVRDLAGSDGCAAFPWAKILEAATESIIRAVRIGPDLETYGGVMDRPPGIRWLCEDLVQAGVPNVWIAAASTGKSTFAAALAVCHAVGHPFLDRATTRGVPLYLDWESDADDFREKIWLVSRCLGFSSVPTVHRLPMRGPAGANASAIANRIDGLGASLVVWDGVQAAGGPIGQHATYESVAMELESVLGLLPRTTHVLLDHVTGDELKAGAVPLKGRGGARKLEWTRNQWTLVLDREAHHEQRHVVGWTHTKINRGAYLPAFGAEILHRPDELGFRVLTESEVRPLRERMEDWRQLLTVLQDAGRPLMNREAAMLWKGVADEKALKDINRIVRMHGRAFVRNEAGMIQTRDGTDRVGANGTAAVAEVARLVPVSEPLFDDGEEWDEPEPLPF